ncbi:sialate O-acetylesterase [Kineococcus sp. TBRC 1896]|uniref:Sialate O-acetylesterase n=1 Tax=Kineococcus mangrovi TaxID=1660183 RepID=A0ABV4I2T9_9ACTN
MNGERAGRDLVVVLGQSNAAGSNTDFDPEGADAFDPRVEVFAATGPDGGRIVPAREPFWPLLGHPPGGVGPGGPFAALLLPTLPADRRVLVVPAAVGGTGFHAHTSYPGVWKVGLERADTPNLFARAVAHVRAALAAAGPDSRVRVVLWHQGETDGGHGRSEAEYAADLDELVAAFRAQVPTAQDVPFLLGGMAPERIAAYPNHAGVAAAHAATPGRVPGTAFAPSPAGHVNDGTTHLTAAAQRLLAANLFAAFTAVELTAAGPGPAARH